MNIVKVIRLTVAMLAVCGLIGCVMKPAGVNAPTTPDKLVGTWNGLQYVSGFYDRTAETYFRGMHIGQLITFTMENNQLVGWGKYRNLGVPVRGRLYNIKFTNDGVDYTVDYVGGKLDGCTGYYSVWWINSPEFGEQLKGQSRGILSRPFKVRLNRCGRCSPASDPGVTFTRRRFC